MDRAVAETALPADADGAESALGAALEMPSALPLTLPAAVNDTGYWLKCLATAVLLHSAVLAVLNWPHADTTIGGAGSELEAVSVDIVAASALESTLPQDAANTGAASTARLDDREGSEQQQTAAADNPDRTAQQKPETAAKATPADIVIPEAQIKPLPLPEEAPAIAIAPVKADKPVDGPEPAEAPRPQPTPVAAPAPSAPSESADAAVAGGATARAASATEAPTPAAAAALAGELGAFAREVQKAVARTPPRVPAGISARGEVVITFALGLDGSLLSARIQTSSGSATLDDAALAAVRRARFPSPPPGSQLAQLVYKFPVKFR